MADEKRKLEEAQQREAGVPAVKGDLDKKLASATGEHDALNAPPTAIQIEQAVVDE